MSEENENLDESVESSTTTEETSTEEVSASEEEPKKNGVQKRINQLTRERYEAKQRADELEKRLSELESKPKEVTTETKVAPKEDDFDTDAEFQQASAKFIADTAAEAALSKLRSENETKTTQSKEAEKQAEIATKKEKFEANVESKRSSFEDFDEVAYGHQFMDLGMAEMIFDMDKKGPEVAYHLGTHQDEAAKIFSLPPVQRAIELTKLEFQVKALEPKLISDAPDAIKPLGGSEKIEEDPDKMTADQWQQWEYNRLRAKQNG
jgi:hypothetical protein